MTDVHDQQTRSYNMSQIKARNTKPELFVRKSIFSKGFRYKLYDKNLPGKPDIVLPKYKTVVFINGCFWHGHKNCQKFVLPKSRSEWWLRKITANITNDKKNIALLQKMGWKVIVVWECQLNNAKSEQTINRIVRLIKH